MVFPRKRNHIGSSGLLYSMVKRKLVDDLSIQMINLDRKQRFVVIFVGIFSIMKSVETQEHFRARLTL